MEWTESNRPNWSSCKITNSIARLFITGILPDWIIRVKFRHGIWGFLIVLSSFFWPKCTWSDTQAAKQWGLGILCVWRAQWAFGAPSRIWEGTKSFPDCLSKRGCFLANSVACNAHTLRFLVLNLDPEILDPGASEQQTPNLNSEYHFPHCLPPCSQWVSIPPAKQVVFTALLANFHTENVNGWIKISTNSLEFTSKQRRMK